MVLRRTDAAYAWVTPTRLRPSTSMIWSFTCILTHSSKKKKYKFPHAAYKSVSCTNDPCGLDIYPLSRTTRVSRYQKGKTSLDFTEATHSEWQWHPLGHMQVCTLLQTDNHASTQPLSFLHAGCPSCHPTNSVKAPKAHCYLLNKAKGIRKHQWLLWSEKLSQGFLLRMAVTDGTDLPSRAAAPPSVNVLMNIPSFSSPASAPTPIPMILRPRPSLPASHCIHLKYKVICKSTHTHIHTRLMALCPGLPGSAGTSKIKPIWILLKQETVSGSGISWAICKSAPRSRQTTTPAPHHSVFTGRMPFLPPNQQHQSTEVIWHKATSLLAQKNRRVWPGFETSQPLDVNTKYFSDVATMKRLKDSSMHTPLFIFCNFLSLVFFIL